MMTRTQVIWLILLNISSFLIGLVVFPLLGDRSPIHWNIQGEVDGYGSRLEAAFLFPALIALTTFIFVALLLNNTLRTSLEKSGKYYGRMIIAAVTTLVGIQLAIILQVFGTFDTPRYTMLILSVFFVVIGNWMGKIRRNKIMGIRTPWTLASDIIWERTHRIGGRLLVLTGLGTGLTTLFVASPFASLLVFFVGATANLIWSMAYSWWLYRLLPEKPEAV